MPKKHREEAWDCLQRLGPGQVGCLLWAGTGLHKYIAAPDKLILYITSDALSHASLAGDSMRNTCIELLCNMQRTQLTGAAAYDRRQSALAILHCIALHTGIHRYSIKGRGAAQY
jgi:hypothetical protein